MAYRRLAAALACLWLAAPGAARAASAETAGLQVALRALGHDPGPADGVSGPATVRALRAFQRARGLAADGVAGPLTRRALGALWGRRLGARALQAGRSGGDVAALQFLLSRRGFATAVDGRFGLGTADALRRFQRTAALHIDGVAGAATLRALRAQTPPAATPVRFLRPLGGAWTDGFGWVAGRRHTGLDFPMPAGTAVGAAGRGVVSFAGYNAFGYGNLVVITHRLGFESWYAHLSRVAVRAGQPVAGGVVIGAVGSTGHSTGPHLHFEARRFGSPVDPTPLMLTARSARTRRAVLRCRPNGDARRGRDADPGRARLNRCP